MEGDVSEMYLTVEQWPFSCQGCGHEWLTAYEKCYADFDGSEVVTWRRSGHPSTTPWSGEPCPACASYRVRVRPFAT